MIIIMSMIMVTSPAFAFMLGDFVFGSQDLRVRRRVMRMDEEEAESMKMDK